MRNALVAASDPVWFWQTYPTSLEISNLLQNCSMLNSVLNPCVANATIESTLSRNNLSKIEMVKVRYSFSIDVKLSTSSSKIPMANCSALIFFRIYSRQKETPVQTTISKEKQFMLTNCSMLYALSSFTFIIINKIMKSTDFWSSNDVLWMVFSQISYICFDADNDRTMLSKTTFWLAYTSFSFSVVIFHRRHSRRSEMICREIRKGF